MNFLNTEKYPPSLLSSLMTLGPIFLWLGATRVDVMSEPVAWLLPGSTASPSRTEGFGFDLWVVYAMWAVVVAVLYIACRWYMEYKRQHDYPWLKYL